MIRLSILISIIIVNSQLTEANTANQAIDKEIGKVINTEIDKDRDTEIDNGTDKEIIKEKVWSISNDQIKYSIYIENRKLISDKLEARHQWLEKYGSDSVSLETNADFAIDLFWTGWRVPGKENNADNSVSLTKNDFQVEKVESKEFTDGIKELYIFLTGINTNLHLLITYQLEPDAFYIRRKLTLSDSLSGLHFVHQLWPIYCQLKEKSTIIKNGGFGQPIAVQIEGGGQGFAGEKGQEREGSAFFGLEYPPSQNNVVSESDGELKICCGYEVGEKIGNSGISSEWAVSGLTPDPYVKLWFNKYLERILVCPLKPYLKYNCWCDIRSPELADGPGTIMNEQNVFRIINDFKRELYDKRGIKLDAFVLDDGWDIYKSDWVLRKDEFPHGLKIIADTLNKMGTNLGLWFGPIGGYSHRDWRVNWMREHGYETVGDQLCLGGKNYFSLFSKRVLDFMQNDHVSHFKWDGIQFSCSEPDHGHPTGVYSRTAIMDSLIDLCNKVRNVNPDAFLNITSGTWLSPWWVKYANTIWMQGDDWGYASVPSLSPRDREMTYRDISLYRDFIRNDFWFPISNLMTVGIIKGHLADLGGPSESLYNFTNNAVFWLARGVSMWELYISPDMLTQDEWDAIAGSILWAKDRFDILKHTEMIGGDPEKEEAYGYLHISGSRGIVAARNPYIEPAKMNVELSASYGLVPDADSLVIERTYPTRWIYPRLFSTGDMLEISLDGFETAIYEIYPLKESPFPIVTGVTFDVKKADEAQYILELYDISDQGQIFNQEKIKSVEVESGMVSRPVEPVNKLSFKSKTNKNQSEIDINCDLEKSINNATLSVLVRSISASADNSFKDSIPETVMSETIIQETNIQEPVLPVTTILIDGKKVKLEVVKQEGAWAWYKTDMATGKHLIKIFSRVQNKNDKWSGNVSVWLHTDQTINGKSLSFSLTENVKEPPLPPRPYPANELKRNIKLGEVNVRLPE